MSRHVQYTEGRYASRWDVDMTFNLMVASRDQYVSPRTIHRSVYVYTIQNEKKTMIYVLRWSQLLGHDIRWPGYIRVLAETSIHLVTKVPGRTEATEELTQR